MDTIPQFLIGAARSGSGKTVLTLSLLRAFRNRGIRVQSFKCGPDYIDTRFHQSAGGRPAVNLDTFLMTADHVRDRYAHYAAAADVAIAEGVMGVFDGYNGSDGSSAQVAALTGLPVVLAIDAKSTAYSVAPVLYGFKHFDRRVQIAGVIFNRVASESHYSHLCRAAADAGVDVLGYLPVAKELEIPSRHLGLSTDGTADFDSFADCAAAIAAQHIDLDRLAALTARTVPASPSLSAPIRPAGRGFRSAVALDKAFSFVYHENIEYLRRYGEVCFFSPLTDSRLPDGVDFVYLPGGYPELYLPQLSANNAMHDALRRYAEAGGRLWAECGGMMYLMHSITDEGGQRYPMAGVLAGEASMQQAKLTLGYRQFDYNGCALRGHEFHYSHVDSTLAGVAEQYTAQGKAVGTKLFRHRNVLAGYTHLYWAELNDLMALFQ